MTNTKKQSVPALKNALNSFLSDVSNVNKFNHSQKEPYIYSKYKELHFMYEKVDIDSISTKFSADEMKAIHFLHLGQKEEAKFDELVNLIQGNAKDAILAVSDFIKSNDGFRLIDDLGKSLEDENYPDEITQIFGSSLGTEITEECVKSLMTEKVGSVIGYALGRFCEEDYEEYQHTKHQKDWNTFLKEKIRSRDITASYTYDESENGIAITCKINENVGLTGSTVRGKNIIDHCFIDHKNKKIIFGFSSSDKTMKDQQFTHQKVYKILQAVVGAEIFNGEPNKYYEYKLEPFAFTTGRFVATQTT